MSSGPQKETEDYYAILNVPRDVNVIIMKFI